jgi:anti-anti-sigma factor
MPTNGSDFLVRTGDDDGRAVVRFPAGTTLSELNADEFEHELLAAADGKEHPVVVVDLGGVVMLTSVILAKFVAINSRFRIRGGRLTILNPNPTVYQVFKMTRLDTLLDLRTGADPMPV